MHAAHHRPRRPPERRQVDAVQSAARGRATRSSPTFPGLTRDRHYGRARARRARVPRRRHRRLRAESRRPASCTRWRADAAGDRRSRRRRVHRRRARRAHAAGPRRSPSCCASRGARSCSWSTRPKACRRERAVAEFHELGAGRAAADLGGARRGRARPDRASRSRRSPPRERRRADDGADDDASGRVKVAIVGRPNVGKSTLVNALLGEERVIAFDEPGTTRDAIYLDFERDGQPLHADRHRRHPPPRQGVRSRSRSSR